MAATYGPGLALQLAEAEKEIERLRAENARLRARIDELEGDLCPMGCGRTTEDVAGGPCSRCWEKAPRG